MHPYRYPIFGNAEIGKYKLAKLVIGTICGKPNVVIGSMRSPDEITEQMSED